MGLEFENENVKICEIMIDPYNPRFSGQYANLSQEELLAKVWADGPTKELLASMEIGLKWVNNIVVRRVASYQLYLGQKELSPDVNFGISLRL